jgi:hypothetical protein
VHYNFEVLFILDFICCTTILIDVISTYGNMSVLLSL